MTQDERHILGKIAEMDGHVSAVREDVAEMRTSVAQMQGGVRVAQYLLSGLIIIVISVATWGLIKAEQAHTRSVKNERVIELMFETFKYRSDRDVH